MQRMVRNLVLFVAAIFLSGGAVAADAVSGSLNGGYGRLLFTLVPGDQVSAQSTGGVLTISFSRKVALTPDAVAQALPSYISSARSDPDGKTFRFALSQQVRVHSSSSGPRFAVDLASQTYTGTPPDLPPPPPVRPKQVDLDKMPVLKVRSGAYHNFTRIVFDWPKAVPYKVFPGAGRLTVRFDAVANPDFSAISRQIPPWVKTAGWHLDGNGIVVELATDMASGFHDFRDGTHVVIDVLAPKTDADAYNPPGQNNPTVTALPGTAQAPVATSAPAKLAASAPKPAVSKPAPSAQISLRPPKQPGPVAQLTKIAAQTATAPAPAPAAAPVTGTPAPVSPEAKAAADAATPAQTPAEPTADSKLTRDGAVLMFPGAGRRAAAVFTRGLTAWIILENAAPLDVPKLKSQLGNFPVSVDAASDAKTTQLRISLKQPEAIAAIAEGSTLKVIVSPQATSSAIALGFARNQENPTHSSISTLLPGATRIMRLVDPVAGDELFVIPALVGRQVTNERDFVEFSALPSAAGMVLLPYVDDLAVSLNATRVTITRPGGLSLTPPSMPAVGTPETLAGSGDGPCFLDFANWRRQSGGTFLATERRLRAATARLAPQAAGKARLALARFYLANHFAAEALGMIDIMQAGDPGLASDMQLQTMRAAADLAMGRLHDARNALVGAQFDTDRHAALWRGLTETAMENWAQARTDLDRAAPVLASYDPEMQSRVRLAAAEAALGVGALEVADAQLAKLPDQLAGPLGLQATLDRARLAAAENHRGQADNLFAVVEGSNDEWLASQAIYYRVQAGLQSGSMSTQQAINALERLRFRWRGDALELKTLRKLAAIYFGQKRWREGLGILRVAATSFPNDDGAMQAQDDMRAGFVDLFLKGKADTMPPVEALAVFYDFIELTPIGPDGDEMIRRMSDRLVNVDLLGPAEDLLNYQITKRLDGVARAQVATKLAMVQLMDHKPQAVIETLRSTQISTLPDDVAHQRLLMEAHALAEMKQWDQALDLIAVDQQPDTQKLRADIYWRSANWPLAGKSAEDALGARFSDAAPLSADERQVVMRAAVAYSLANDEASLERLRSHFADKMAASPDASAFAVLSDRIDMHGLAFRDAAARIASIDTLKTFMKDIQRRVD